MSKSSATFRSRLIAGERMVGTFLKTPSPIAAEVLALSDLDVFCIDAEHAPFGRLETDLCIAAFRARNRPVIVRVTEGSHSEIRNALDSGASGILVPHVAGAEQAADIVKAAYFGEGGRGFAGSTRASDYTKKSMQDHLAGSAAETAIILQIEDLAALGNVSEIAAVDGVDAIFIGRIDLAVAMGKSPMDGEVIATVRRIVAEARDTDTTVGMYTPDNAEIPDWNAAGVSLYLLSSDQSFVLAGANALARIAD